MRQPFIRSRHRRRLDQDVSVSEMFFTASGEFALLRTMRSQHGSQIRLVRIRGADFASTTSRAHLPPLWRSLSSEYSFLWTMRPEHGLACVTDKFGSSAYNVPTQG